jgi:hypothetical protein
MLLWFAAWGIGSDAAVSYDIKFCLFLIYALLLSIGRPLMLSILTELISSLRRRRLLAVTSACSSSLVIVVPVLLLLMLLMLLEVGARGRVVVLLLLGTGGVAEGGLAWVCSLLQRVNQQLWNVVVFIDVSIVDWSCSNWITEFHMKILVRYSLFRIYVCTARV